jgi:bromodomain-containing factor 1
VLFDDPEPKTTLNETAQSKPTTNGNHVDMDASVLAVEPAVEPTTNVSAGIDGVAQFLPDSQQDNNSLFGDEDTGATVTNAVEAPTSDVRDEPATAEELSSATQATAASTQEVSETQIVAKEEAPAEDSMETYRVIRSTYKANARPNNQDRQRCGYCAPICCCSVSSYCRS